MKCLEWFLKDDDTEDWSNDAENSAAHHRKIKYILTHSNKNQLFNIVIIYHHITVA